MAFDIYLGANTPLGFFSYFEPFAESAKKVVILKGGPGCGKSTLMKKLSAYGEKKGHKTLCIFCSSDSDSLDGVYFPDAGILYLDGTAPHALEARTPGACETLLDLGQCFDTAALSLHLEEIRALNRALADQYSRCYVYLQSAAAVKKNADSLCSMDTDVLARRARMLAQRTIPKKKTGGRGQRHDVFLSSFTKNGLEKLEIPDGFSCFPIFDPMSSGGAILSCIADYAEENGYTVYAAHDPYDPKGDPMHVFLPEAKLAFVSTGRPFGYDNAPGRRIRLDALTGAGNAEKQRIRRDRKIQHLLESCAQDALGEAKQIHDRLEAIYTPHVDFDAVNDITGAELEKLDEMFKARHR